MSVTTLTPFITMLVALSVASERLVEIVKGLVPWLNKQNQDETVEGWRRTVLQVLAVLAGITTAYLSRDYFLADIPRPIATWSILAVGLLASGGSGFWNAILSYVLQLKNMKKAEVEDKQTPEPIKAAKASLQVKAYETAHLDSEK